MFNSYMVAEDDACNRSKQSDDSEADKHDQAKEIDLASQQMRKNSNDMQSEDRSAFSSIGEGKINDAQKKNEMMAFDYENLSSPAEDDEEEKKEITEGRIFNDHAKSQRIQNYG